MGLSVIQLYDYLINYVLVIVWIVGTNQFEKNQDIPVIYYWITHVYGYSEFSEDQISTVVTGLWVETPTKYELKCAFDRFFKCV